MGVRAGLLIITALALAEFAVTPPSIAHAQERPAQARHVSISLVAETRSVVPGHSFHLALRQQIEATLVATPCTAPFMAAALGYAITQPWYRSLAIFEAVGFGMALPYLGIAFSPRLRRFLPKPGPWMLVLKQFLAFPIYGTAVWLTFVLAQETGVPAVTAVLSGL